MNAAVENLAPDPILERLEDQIAWYDRKSGINMHWFKRLKMTEIVSAALIPFLAASSTIPHAHVATGVLGVLITVFEGMLQLNRYHENWIDYRSTCESLRHEKYLFLAGAGVYANVEKPRALLAERVESLVSQESAKWASIQQQDSKGKPA
ncbi:MAG TPA: DUF4231 domain-containing protein [Candidatus Sulfotelmatobacter sp.]|jgi:hypothetical protein